MRIIVLLLIPLLSFSAWPDVITRFNGTEKAIALTFDACETRSRVVLDTALVKVLTNQKVPFTLFVSGKFCAHNAKELRRLARLSYVEIENHGLSHSKNITNMDEAGLAREVLTNSRLIRRKLGVSPKYFRFPYGRCNPGSVKAVESMGFKVVHWSFASGDADPKLTGKAVREWVLRKSRSGSILIFHINGRGWHTAEFLPGVLDALRERGYRFIRLDEVLR